MVKLCHPVLFYERTASLTRQNIMHALCRHGPWPHPQKGLPLSLTMQLRPQKHMETVTESNHANTQGHETRLFTDNQVGMQVMRKASGGHAGEQLHSSLATGSAGYAGGRMGIRVHAHREACMWQGVHRHHKRHPRSGKPAQAAICTL
ncbi:hypothetical protein DUNSADRAFT_17250 [Dunaliella salina]|uniref:Encoded protein n=1 Tax=Dunaliella salina TaxID=3046 RepID=A0ABQ7H093_DUNSA|nr:hypothetical protein DUNSADRAFT_17250 [Dunaliella salina]|eukprot:KAF5840281.1 hypothetical protein DUNSADRAFT_17250 [Dunaliella salina]